MKVILLKDVKGTGKKDQVLEVSDGFARNFLLPRKLAQEATADNVNTMKMNDKALQEKRQKEQERRSRLRVRVGTALFGEKGYEKLKAILKK